MGLSSLETRGATLNSNTKADEQKWIDFLKKIERAIKRGRNPENFYLELKKSMTDPMKIVDTICAFINSGGGSILVGIDEREGVIGAQFDRKVPFKKVKNLVNTYLFPESLRALVQYHVVDYKNKSVGIVIVEQKDDNTLAFICQSKQPCRDIYFVVREGAENKKFSLYELDKLMYWLSLRKNHKLFAYNAMYVAKEIREIYRKGRKYTNNKKRTNTIEVVRLIDEELLSSLVKLVREWKTITLAETFKGALSELYLVDGLDLYAVFRDLFFTAYQERKHILGNLIFTLYWMLMEYWMFPHKYTRKYPEKISEILYCLGADFIDVDIGITFDCYRALSDIAGELFLPIILAYQILLANAIFKKQPSLQVSQSKEFADMITWIQFNDKYAEDDGYYTYLIDAISLVERVLSKKYDMRLSAALQRELYRFAYENALEKLQGSDHTDDEFLSDIPPSQRRKIEQFCKKYRARYL